MAKEKRKVLAKDLHGMSIYHEEKRTVYAPFYTSNGYVLTDDNCKEYRYYVTNYLFAFLIFSSVSVFKYWLINIFTSATFCLTRSQSFIAAFRRILGSSEASSEEK